MSINTAGPPLLADEETNMSLSEIYDTVVANGELIITIPLEEQQALRTGLAKVKAAVNAKFRASGLIPDTATLSYVTIPVEGRPDAIKVHITLSKKATITVLAMQLPDNEI